MRPQNHDVFDHLDLEPKAANQDMENLSDMEFNDDWVSHIDDFNDDFSFYNGDD